MANLQQLGNLNAQNSGLSHAEETQGGGYSSALPDVFNYSIPTQTPSSMMNGSKKEETIAFDFISFDTKYYSKVGIGHSLLTFLFITPPVVGPDVPYTFGLIGDLGQSYDSNHTLNHYKLNPTKGKDELFVGDLSYVDNYPNHDNTRKTASTTCLTIMGIKFSCYVYGR